MKRRATKHSPATTTPTRQRRAGVDRIEIRVEDWIHSQRDTGTRVKHSYRCHTKLANGTHINIELSATDTNFDIASAAVRGIHHAIVTACPIELPPRDAEPSFPAIINEVVRGRLRRGEEPTGMPTAEELHRARRTNAA